MRVWLALFACVTLFAGCAKNEIVHDSEVKCDSYKTYASASFEVSGDMSELVEKSAKKALTKTCYKKDDNAKLNMRVKVDSKQNLNTQEGFIKDKVDNTFSVNIVVIGQYPTDSGGLTTLTSKQNATLNLKAAPIADIGDKGELNDKEVAPFVEKNVQAALNNLYKDVP
ncbi:hypothetical protein DCO58_01815 [Helicobacter saguini]|uniref:Uncharacterized protein n=1 Tax=Helicobacter saguini TaxID=1548018 RepID=A0A347VRJ0_9HELI|nr:hypothetical protein [Helicobacter saguini]MWV62882.1 hypothetical protein [Helicobacter saguini]MWV66448.1 hypothetical protein [Helicobacter saguini]MWV68797.1 hypothetical protein [Helicobacter saguini]MWV71648.1 hypothetical protein [Helicobacter saguini]TLD94451.1 hypothetical protein LS64_005855 [Helicobacter saguini]